MTARPPQRAREQGLSQKIKIMPRKPVKIPEDTICAPASAPVTRTDCNNTPQRSGSLGTARSIFSKHMESPRAGFYGSILHEGQIIDDVVLVYYQGPAFYGRR
jgi:tRNA U34 5-carboxymethylaminomethyl modifying GTPase MnmE/TrmE